MIPSFCGLVLFFHIPILVINFTSYAIANVAGSSLGTGTAVNPPSVGNSQTDNLSPANADPTLNISCIGDRYDSELPISAGFNPNEVSMQQLCAKTEFNGGQPGQHIGGWCNWSRHHSQVVFDLGVAAEINPVLANPRVMLACSYRCFCNYGLGAYPVQPKTAPYANTWESNQTYELQVDVIDDFDVVWTSNMGKTDPSSEVDVPQISHAGTLGQTFVQVAEVQTMSQLAFSADRLGTEPRFTYTSMNPDNEIECHGVLPRFPLPSPYRNSDFSILQELCAVQFSGGNRLVPLSMLCFPSPVDHSPSLVVQMPEDIAIAAICQAAA